jgi:hypothetical protein
MARCKSAVLRTGSKLTRHPQTGNCGAPDSAKRFTRVNLFLVSSFARDEFARIRLFTFASEKSAPIDLCINNAIIGVQEQNTYAQTEG